MVSYELLKVCPHTGARRGRLKTPHGVVETPFFMPVGTYGAVKTVGSEELEALGFQQILSNTYHLSERPGAELIEQFGGLHRFIGWSHGILTDSGGYQVMSLGSHRKISEDGVRFKSILDGRELFLSPERAIQLQRSFGVDVSMALDVCPSFPCTREEAAEAMQITHRWAERNLDAASADQAVFGIVQGGVHRDLRTESAETLACLPFAGFAVGGVSVGEPTEMQYPVVSHTAPLLPAQKARYLMGVGHPKDILHAVASGIDMFDCVLPTRMARHHALYTLRGRVNALNAKWSTHDGPHDPDSVFPTTERYSAAYLRHLYKIGEPLAHRIGTLHNLAFYSRLMREIREAIENATWPSLVARYRDC